jgi:hypothetical protein
MTFEGWGNGPVQFTQIGNGPIEYALAVMSIHIIISKSPGYSIYIFPPIRKVVHSSPVYLELRSSKQVHPNSMIFGCAPAARIIIVSESREAIPITVSPLGLR